MEQGVGVFFHFASSIYALVMEQGRAQLRTQYVSAPAGKK